jgi:hypothetical protein
VEAWLVAIGALLALAITGVVAVRRGRTIEAVRRAAAAAPAADLVTAISSMVAHTDQLEAARVRDARDREAFVESLSQGVLTVGTGFRIVAANGAAHAHRDLPRYRGRGGRPRSARERLGHR